MSGVLKCKFGLHELDWNSNVALCDDDGDVLCEQHIRRHNISHTLNRVVWRNAGVSNGANIQCNNCNKFYQGSQWIGYACLEHDHHLCFRCMKVSGQALLKNHRITSHGPNRAVTWILHAPDENTTLRRDPFPVVFNRIQDIPSRRIANDPGDISTWGPSGVPDRMGVFSRTQARGGVSTPSGTFSTFRNAVNSTSDENDVFYTSPSGFKLRKSGGGIPKDLQAKLNATYLWDW